MTNKQNEGREATLIARNLHVATTMKTKYLLITFVALFLVFVCIWILSPRVGEKINVETGTDIKFEQTSDEVPEILPDGYIRLKQYSDGVVYMKQNSDGTTEYVEYVGNGQFVPYDINKPSYIVKTTFDRRIYQIKDMQGNLLEDYRALDSKGVWQVVDANYRQLFSIPSSYKMATSVPNLYVIESKSGETKTIEYKFLTKVGDLYAWLSPEKTDNWLAVSYPEAYVKTEIANVYKIVEGENVFYKKALLFNDVNQTIIYVVCDADGNLI